MFSKKPLTLAILRQKIQVLSTAIDAYTGKIQAESAGEVPPCFRSSSAHRVKGEKYDGAFNHLGPAARALIDIIDYKCFPTIKISDREEALHEIEEHIGAIASMSVYTQGATSRFNAYFNQLLLLLEQFKKITNHYTDRTVLLALREPSINPRASGMRQISRDSFDASPGRGIRTQDTPVNAWTKQFYTPLHTELLEFLAHTDPTDPRHHGVNNYLCEVLRFTKVAADLCELGGDSQIVSANDNKKGAERALGAVASWSPYFKYKPSCMASAQFAGYYQRTCQLLEAAKTTFLPNNERSSAIKQARPSLKPFASGSRRQLLTARSPFAQNDDVICVSNARFFDRKSRVALAARRFSSVFWSGQQPVLTGQVIQMIVRSPLQDA